MNGRVAQTTGVISLTAMSLLLALGIVKGVGGAEPGDADVNARKPDGSTPLQWAVFNGDHFATYLPTTGVSFYSNTADGYANYESTDATTATATYSTTRSSCSAATWVTATRTMPISCRKR